MLSKKQLDKISEVGLPTDKIELLVLCDAAITTAIKLYENFGWFVEATARNNFDKSGHRCCAYCESINCWDHTLANEPHHVDCPAAMLDLE